MLCVRMASGAEVAQLPLEEAGTVRELKQRLQQFCGMPRFRQRILSGSSLLEDDAKLTSSMDLTLALQSFAEVSLNLIAELLSVAEMGRVSEMEAILQGPQDPNPELSMEFYPEEEYETPLVLASSQGHMETVGLLLEAEADPNGGYAGSTPLGVAELPEIMRLLLQSRADPNMPFGPHDQTPLGEACTSGKADIVSLLLDSRADPQREMAVTDFGSDFEERLPPLFVACQEHEHEIVRLLLGARSEIDQEKDGMTLLATVCCTGDAKAVRLMLENGADPNCPLHPDSDMAQRFSSPDVRVVTPLFVACENGEVEITQLLLEARADPLLCGLKPGNISLHDRVACKRRRLFEDSEDDGCSPNARHMHVRRVQFAVRRYET